MRVFSGTNASPSNSNCADMRVAGFSGTSGPSSMLTNPRNTDIPVGSLLNTNSDSIYNAYTHSRNANRHLAEHSQNTLQTVTVQKEEHVLTPDVKFATCAQCRESCPETMKSTLSLPNIADFPEITSLLLKKQRHGKQVPYKKENHSIAKQKSTITCTCKHKQKLSTRISLGQSEEHCPICLCHFKNVNQVWQHMKYRHGLGKS